MEPENRLKHEPVSNLCVLLNVVGKNLGIRVFLVQASWIELRTKQVTYSVKKNSWEAD